MYPSDIERLRRAQQQAARRAAYIQVIVAIALTTIAFGLGIVLGGKL